MLGDEKDTEQEEGKTEVKENESKPRSLERLIKSGQATTQANANIADDQELKVLPENEEGEEKIVEVDSTIKSLPRATTTTPIGKRMKQQQQKKGTTIPNVSKQLEQQTTEIKKIKSILQSQSELIKQLKSQLKQVQKQTSQIQKHAVMKKKGK
jgi:DNA repair exonuclease SbcCD ATPase subunit